MKTVKRTQEVWKELELKDGSKIKALVQEEIKVPAYKVTNYSREYKENEVLIIKTTYFSEYKKNYDTNDKEYIESLFKECNRWKENLKKDLTIYQEKINDIKKLLKENERDLNNLKEGRYTIRKNNKE